MNRANGLQASQNDLDEDKYNIADETLLFSGRHQM